MSSQRYSPKLQKLRQLNKPSTPNLCIFLLSTRIFTGQATLQKQGQQLVQLNSITNINNYNLGEPYDF